MSLSTIRTLLISDSAINLVVGDKIAVGVIQQETEAPFILIEEGERTPNNCKDGTSQLDDYTVLVTVVAPTYAVVDQLLKDTRRILDNYRDSDFMKLSFSGQKDHYDGTQEYHLKTHSYKSLLKVENA